jgi:glycosyltransferase involved in cell wall biosynthesis
MNLLAKLTQQIAPVQVNKPEPSVDICLLLEGTYPYVRGGVSSWVHQIISGLPEYSFHIVFLGGHPELYQTFQYELPENVVGFDKYCILAPPKQPSRKQRKLIKDPKIVETWNAFLSHFDYSDQHITADILNEISKNIGAGKQFTLADFLHSEPSWQVLLERYNKTASDKSFLDFFWTYRNIYQPIFLLAQISRELPDAKCFHSISTGYAGFLGALAKQRKQKNYIISEHGIYTKERKIDLSQAQWIRDNHSEIDQSMHKDMDNTRKMWIRFFEQLGLSAYHQSQQIVSLFSGYQNKQIIDGAPAKRTRVIVNGIKTQKFDEAYQARPQSPPLVVGLIGRVVPIKDIKTFIRTIRSMVNTFPSIRGLIIGPQEEDQKYADECRLLIQSLDLEDHIEMTGNQNVQQVLTKLGVVILTSISEAQPLVLLEAMAAGIPCVATDVGACSEMLIGANDEDKQLGPSGIIVPIANPNENARALTALLSDPQKWRDYGDSGRKRVTRYYEEKDMFFAYRSLYKEAINGGNRI